MRKGRKTRKQSTLSLMITGGGTGGHVYPGIAVAKEIVRRLPSANVVFVGATRGIEAKIVPHEGFPFEPIEIRGMKHRLSRHKLRLLSRLPKAVLAAIRLLKQHRPQLVLGTGGYVSLPVMYAAYLRHIPTIILETHRQPGLVSRLLGRSVDKIAICFAESAAFFPQKKVMFTGTPIRREFFLVGETPPPDKGKKLNILVIAGSLDAHSINYTMMAALDDLKDYQEQLAFTHQTGSTDFEYVKTGYKKRDFRAEVFRYIQDIPKMYAKSHLIICRAGSSTMAEIQASTRAAIFIPYPDRDHHQETNALALKESGIARLISQQQLSGKTLSQEILNALNHPEEFVQVWPNTRRLPGDDATAQLARICFHVALGEDATEIEF